MLLALIVVAVWLLAKIRLVAVPLIIAMLLATVLVPPQRWLRRRGFSPLVATWSVFLVGRAVVAGFGVWLIPVLVGQASQFGDLLTNGLDRIQKGLVSGPLGLSATQLQNFVTQVQSELTANAPTILQGALRGTQLAVEVVAGVVLTAAFTFFVVKDGEDLTRDAFKLLRSGVSSHLDELARRTWLALSGYVRGMAANGLVNGTLMALALLITGVPLVLPLAFVTFVAAFVPILGAVVAGALAALVALAAKGWATSLVIVGATIVIHHVEGYVIGPLVMGRAVRLRPLTVVTSLALGATVAGLIGAILAVPIAATIATFLTYRREIMGEAAGI